MSSYTSNVTSAFVDLATLDTLETYLYGGDDAVTYFVRQHVKSTWFSQVPVVLASASGTADFGNTWSVTISRAADYLLQTWLEVTTPVITAVQASSADTHRNFWCKNFMHNLVKEVTITFNDLVAMKIESTQLDFWAAFSVSASKKAGYDAMIGAGVKTLAANGQDAVFLHGLDASVAHKLCLPLPFFFSRESGIALPTAALPYNDMRINFTMRTAAELLSGFELAGNTPMAASATTYSNSAAISLTKARVWANYAIVTNEERTLMGATTRDIAIEQMQAQPITSYTTDGTAQYDIRFSHGIKALMFGLRNTALDTTAQTGVGIDGSGGDQLSRYHTKVVAKEAAGVYDRKSPIDNVTLLYENTTRLGSVPSNFFTHLQPFYHAESIPTSEPGIHMYSYALDLLKVDPCGSTNYGMLTNISIIPANVSGIGNGWELVVNGISHNIVRVTGGALGFPIL
jgi:hypothetical protein